VSGSPTHCATGYTPLCDDQVPAAMLLIVLQKLAVHINNNDNHDDDDKNNNNNNITCSKNCKYKTAATLYTQKHGLSQERNCECPA
jgi:hypothetical protein